MSEPFDHLLEKYATLVVRLGVNVQPGQPVVIQCLPEQSAVARALAEAAYRVGAASVSIKYDDPYLQRAAVLHAPEETLGVTSPFELDEVRSWRETRPALIRLTGNPHPGLMDGLDPARLAKSAPTDRIGELFPLLSTSHLAWTIVGAPTPGWADSVGVGSVAELWEAVAQAMRLDQDDPVAAWRAHIAKLKGRADALNANAFDRVRYQGPGTDVTIGLAPQSRWQSAESESSDGVAFVPNMPTEEVFLSPDWRRAEGTVRTSAPFFLATMGAMVEGLELELRDGTITGARSSTWTRRCGRRVWSTRTCCSTRTPAPTSPGERASPSPSTVRPN
jgi:aminopeptidase